MNLQRWSIDAPVGSVTFIATSSIPPIRTTGSATGWFEAALDDTGFAPDIPIQGRLEVPLSGLRSGNPLIDNEMRRRVDTAKHPLIIAQLDSTEEIGAGGATIIGTIEFLGIEVLVEGDLTILPGPRLTGSGEFDVGWWDLKPPKLFTMRVNPIVTVEIDLPLV